MSKKVFNKITNQTTIEELDTIFTEYLDDYIMKTKRTLDGRYDALKKEDPDYYNLLELLFEIPKKEAALMDKYQNMGRIIFRRLGSIIETLTLSCLKAKLGGELNAKIPNTVSSSPKKFGIDWLNEDLGVGYEIKWRYSTTDGTTVKKIKNMATQLKNDGYKPVFLSFYKAKRKQSIRCYNQITDHFLNLGGEVYVKDQSFEKIKEITDFDLINFFENYTPPTDLKY